MISQPTAEIQSRRIIRHDISKHAYDYFKQDNRFQISGAPSFKKRCMHAVVVTMMSSIVQISLKISSKNFHSDEMHKSPFKEDHTFLFVNRNLQTVDT